MALFPPPHLSNLPTYSKKTHYLLKPQLLHPLKKQLSLVFTRATEKGAGNVAFACAAVEEKLDRKKVATSPELGEKDESLVGLNGAMAATTTTVPNFQDPRWVDGTWDLKQFSEGGKTDWDAVIDAEAKRRKWLEDSPESSSNDNLVLFDTSIIPWWAWIKRFHLPEAELLNGRAAMIGFFMAYLVDSLTGIGLVDQMGNFFCKTLLFVAVIGVLLIRKNEDLEGLKKLLDETTLYDKQWRAAWQDDSPSSSKGD